MADPRALTVMTINVGAGLARDSDVAGAIIAEDPDVVAFVELPRAQALRLRDRLGERYPHSAFFEDGNEGRGILTRRPLLAATMLEVAEGRPDVLARIDVAGRKIAVVIVHPRPQRVTRTGLGFDFASLRQLLRTAEVAMEAAPAILLGDLNMSPRHPGYKRLERIGLVDAFGRHGEGLGLTFPARVGYAKGVHARFARSKVVPMVRFDYILTTPDLAVEAAWVGTDAGSDHLPVLARLRIGDRD